jgi:hypothetical protein
MIYYAIVDKLKKDHKPGVYGRRKYNQEEIDRINEEKKKLATKDDGLISSTISLFNDFAISLFSSSDKIGLQHEDPNGKTLIFDNALMKDDYDIDDQMDLFYGIFDNYIAKEKIFESILKSKGGSTLIIIERNDIPSYMHFGGSAGKFNYGLYCAHPKHDDILLPLDGSAELIKNMVLEETLRAYEALGAKKIVINDLTDIKIGSKNEKDGVTVGADFNLKNETLREKTFGKGIFDPNRALRNSVFIHDLPNVITTINGRINGNQLVEKFVENINLSIGLDVGVMGMFSSKTNFNYQRNWSFEVEFYDKNEIDSLTLNQEQNLINENTFNDLSDKISTIFKHNTLSQYELGLGAIKEQEYQLMSKFSEEQRKVLIDKLVGLANKDGDITFKELEFILTISDKLDLNPEETINHLSANYYSVLFFLNQRGKESNDLILYTINAKNIKAQFYKNSRIFVFDDTNKLLAKGTYYNGGRRIVFENGKTIESNNIEKNILAGI